MDIREILNIDSLYEAEKITGKSYKDDEETSNLGLLFHLKKVETVNYLMDITNDTKFSEKTEDYLRKIKETGFEIVYTENFKNDDIIETLYICWHKEYSILLKIDTFNGNRNSAICYYNWSPNELTSTRYVESGKIEGLTYNENYVKIECPFKEPRWDFDNETYEVFSDRLKEFEEKFKIWRKENNLKAVWVGSHDVREAIKLKINDLNSNGVFLKKWINKPFLWLLHYKDTENKDYDYKSINNERISKLPEYVRECL